MGRDRREGTKTGGEFTDMASESAMSSFDWIVISLVVIYVAGEFLAAQAGKLSNNRQLRKLSGRKSIGNMGRGSMNGGRGSAMARGSFMVNSRIAEEEEEDENNDTFEDKTQPEIPEVIPEVEEDEDSVEESAGESTEVSEISDNQDKQEAENSEKKDSITDKKSVQEMV